MNNEWWIIAVAFSFKGEKASFYSFSHSQLGEPNCKLVKSLRECVRFPVLCSRFSNGCRKRLFRRLHPWYLTLYTYFPNLSISKLKINNNSQQQLTASVTLFLVSIFEFQFWIDYQLTTSNKWWYLYCFIELIIN